MTPNPREDALAKLIAEMKAAAQKSAKWPFNRQFGERHQEASKPENVLALIDVLSVPPSQSERDDEKLVEAMMVAANDVLNDDDTDHAGAMRAALAVACNILTLSPTPYVRPAAEIRAVLSDRSRNDSV